MKNIILCITIIALCCAGCASFSNQSFRKEYIKITEGNLSELSGAYFLPYIKNLEHPFSEFNGHVDLYSQIVNAPPWKSRKNKLDSLQVAENQYVVQLDVIDAASVNIGLYENNRLIKDTLIAGKLKNGMFYLKNIELDCQGIPYIMGGCLHSKRRIGLSKRGNIIVNTAVDNTGALLLVIGTGYTFNSSYEFEKIKKVDTH
ncbi:hypothetical protein GCM10022393_00280 [Aquimarina addita]|uniref:DUF4251 domain-containing protein n=1 Tax=Aquimarina addita TaxID=870485 RepID=A0ABP7X7I4_9FLAO